MKYTKPDSYSYKIIKGIVYSGEFPYSSLNMLSDNELMLKRTLRSMAKDGLISIIGSQATKTIRFKKSVFPYLEEIDVGWLEHYLEASENHKFRGGTVNGVPTGTVQTWRRHRLAEVYSFVDSLNILFLKKDKPTLMSNSVSISEKDSGNYFYCSKEIKKINENEKNKISFTRIMGLIISKGGIYPIYNANRGLMKWNQHGELKTKIYIERIINSCHEKYNKKEKFDLNSAIIFGKNMDVALEILTNTDKRKDENDFELLSFDNTYPNIHFFTMDQNGKNQMNLLLNKNWKERLLIRVFGSRYDKKNSYNIECDAYANGQYFLVFLDGNIGKLKRFKNASMVVPPRNLNVICFPWQKNFVETYIPEVTLQLVSPSDIFEKGDNYAKN